jgi:hypothetical protein
MDSKVFKSLVTKLRRTADKKDVCLRPSSFSKQLDRAFGVVNPLKRQEQIYVSTVSYAMALATELANSGLARQLLERLESGIDEYMPGYPPISPVTDSHFYCSTYMSYRFGVEHETAAEIIRKVFQEWDVDQRGIESLRRLCCSRSGIFETRAVSPGRTLVRELVTDREFFLYPSAGYPGRPGELRFSRVAIPAEVTGDTFFEVTTPYILTGVDAGEWTEYLQSDIPDVATRRDPLCGPDPERVVLPHSDIADRLAALFEDDCGVMLWNDFIMDGYSNYQKSAIFLTGIPNRPETLPHNDAFEEPATVRSEWKHRKSTPRGDFDFSPNLIDEEGEFDHEEVNEYFQTLQEQFEQSPESEALADQDTSYISLLLSCGLDYFSALPTTLSEGELKEILFDLIPRKVTMDADEADPLIREFKAFFGFLHREFSVTTAARLATICDESAAKKLKTKLSDSSNFGLAKSFFSAGRAAGFDMTSEEDIAEFTARYNQQLAHPLETDQQAPTLVREKTTVGRNEPCPCGSGKKFKKCCLKG